MPNHTPPHLFLPIDNFVLFEPGTHFGEDRSGLCELEVVSLSRVELQPALNVMFVEHFLQELCAVRRNVHIGVALQDENRTMNPCCHSGIRPDASWVGENPTRRDGCGLEVRLRLGSDGDR
jgi:hypothetical protein